MLGFKLTHVSKRDPRCQYHKSSILWQPKLRKVPVHNDIRLCLVTRWWYWQINRFSGRLSFLVSLQPLYSLLQGKVSLWRLHIGSRVVKYQNRTSSALIPWRLFQYCFTIPHVARQVKMWGCETFHDSDSYVDLDNFFSNKIDTNTISGL